MMLPKILEIDGISSARIALAINYEKKQLIKYLRNRITTSRM